MFADKEYFGEFFLWKVLQNMQKTENIICDLHTVQNLVNENISQNLPCVQKIETELHKSCMKCKPPWLIIFKIICTVYSMKGVNIEFFRL